MCVKNAKRSPKIITAYDKNIMKQNVLVTILNEKALHDMSTHSPYGHWLLDSLVHGFFICVCMTVITFDLYSYISYGMLPCVIWFFLICCPQLVFKYKPLWYIFYLWKCKFLKGIIAQVKITRTILNWPLYQTKLLFSTKDMNCLYWHKLCVTLQYLGWTHLT